MTAARICPNFLVRKTGESHSQKLTGQHCGLRDIRIDPGCGWNRPHCSAGIRFWYRSDAFGALCSSLRVSPGLALDFRSHNQKSQSRSETGIFEIRDEIAIVMLLIRISVFFENYIFAFKVNSVQGKNSAKFGWIRLQVRLFNKQSRMKF